jgi:hypothetical protein
MPKKLPPAVNLSAAPAFACARGFDGTPAHEARERGMPVCGQNLTPLIEKSPQDGKSYIKKCPRCDGEFSFSRLPAEEPKAKRARARKK